MLKVLIRLDQWVLNKNGSKDTYRIFDRNLDQILILKLSGWVGRLIRTNANLSLSFAKISMLYKSSDNQKSSVY